MPRLQPARVDGVTENHPTRFEALAGGFLLGRDNTKQLLKMQTTEMAGDAPIAQNVVIYGDHL